MAPNDEIDNKAEEWFNESLLKLRYSQDYSVCYGHSQKMLNKDGTQKGIRIARPYVRLFSTGVTKLYRIQVLGEKLPEVVYTDEEEQELTDKIEAREERHDKYVFEPKIEKEDI